ncbi:MAG: hypothetical protein E7536_01480 [Ruminococcaceae bacterium]|nr:hypothetical protein [Oscillospiraceae bacterium]
MATLYGIVFAVSLLMIVTCFFVDRKRDTWLMLLFVSVSVCDLGYFLLSLSRTLDGALWANRLAYLGNVFLPFLLLMMIVNLLRFKIPKVLPWALIGINTVMLFITTSGGYLPIYYKNVSITFVDGVAVLVKDYGPLHSVYKIYLFAYFAAMVGIIIYTLVKETAVSIKHSMFLAFVVIGNISIWLVENLIHSQFEFLSISYIVTEGLILLLYGILQDYEKMNKAEKIPDTIVTEKSNSDSFTEEEINNILTSFATENNLSEREKEVLKFILEHKKRKEIAESLFVTESTIKKHTSSIYKKLKVSNRNELFDKVSKLC